MTPNYLMIQSEFQLGIWTLVIQKSTVIPPYSMVLFSLNSFYLDLTKIIEKENRNRNETAEMIKVILMMEKICYLVCTNIITLLPPIRAFPNMVQCCSSPSDCGVFGNNDYHYYLWSMMNTVYTIQTAQTVTWIPVTAVINISAGTGRAKLIYKYNLLPYIWYSSNWNGYDY